MWAYESVFYQIYPLGFCGAPFENDGVEVNRIQKVIEWIPHIKKLGANAIYFSPVFESDTHGYNTRDYTKIDKRLGTNADFAKVCDALHKEGIRVVLDGVFNHVGRGFWAFQDVLQNRENSRYKDWFARIDFGGNSNYNDGLWYEGWEGNYDLVKLNLRNEEVVQHIFNAIKGWIEEFDIDGLRLDVAYCLDEEFARRLRSFCDSQKQDFFLVGEMLHGDYNRMMNDQMFHSVTNYECYKGLFSSFNDMNMFEIAHSINRQFGSENWCLYRGKHLYTFVDNHDVNRIASMLKTKEHLPDIYTLMFMMPGIPAVYYGSEFGVLGDKNQGGDDQLRPEFDLEKMKSEGIRDLTAHIKALAEIQKEHPAASQGDYKQVQLTNRQYAFSRSAEGETLLTVINADSNPFTFNLNTSGAKEDLLTGETMELGGLTLPGFTSAVFKL